MNKQEKDRKKNGWMLKIKINKIFSDDSSTLFS